MKSSENPALSQAEVCRLLCPNPYSCDGQASAQPPDEVAGLFDHAGFLADTPPGSSVVCSASLGTRPRRMLALLNPCSGCNKLAVRCLNVSHGDLRVIFFDANGMTEVPGASIRADGRHRNMFTDAMVYANQALGVRGLDGFVICGGAVEPSEKMNNTFEVVQSEDYDEVD